MGKSLASKESSRREKIQKDKTDMNINDLNLILENFPSSEKTKTDPVESKEESKLLGKRKRKTERELKILRSELKKNVMWTRESIKVMRQHYEADFSMSEQQIYKWWWDQTRKRSTKKNGVVDEMDET